MKPLLRTVFLLILMIVSSHGANLVKRGDRQTIETKYLIKNLDVTLKKVRKNAHFPILFPLSIPNNSINFPHQGSDATKKLYVYVEYLKSARNPSFIFIHIDSSQDCHGAKFCNIGGIIAQKGGKPEMQKR